MATRELVLCLVLSGLTATAIAQTTPVPENWNPISRTAQTTTGRVAFTPNEITFQNGKSLPLARGGQMLFRPEAKKKVMADLYKVTQPDDPVLENGNKLCKGKPVAYLIVWKSEKTGNETDPRTVAPFSGQKFTPALLPEYCAAGPVPAGGVINRFGWWLAYLSMSSGSARCIQSLLRPADRTESERIDAGQ
jgi:hypothetical protein